MTLKLKMMNPDVARIPKRWVDTIPWDPSLSNWDQFTRYYHIVPNLMHRYYLKEWKFARVPVREAAVNVAEKGLLHAVEAFDPDKLRSFEVWAWWDIGMDLHTFWKQKAPKMHLVTPLAIEEVPFELETVSDEEENFRLLLNSDRRLSAVQREILYYTFHDQRPATFIAKQLDLDVHVVRAQLKAALKILSQSFN